MSLSENDMLSIIRQHVEAARQADCLIHWDTRPRTAGEPVVLGRKGQSMPFDGYFVFIDLLPQANWGHPARCLLIRLDGGEVQSHEVEFPPHVGDYPPSYRTLRLA